MKTKYKPRLVAYVSVGNVNEQERDELVQMWAFLLERDGVDARVYEYGYERGCEHLDGLNGDAIVAVRFNGGDIDRVALALDMTSGDLLDREVALGMGE
jgi:hypothetical protein